MEAAISDADLAATRVPLEFGRIVIIGGGCYGSWYAQQLARATARGALRADDIVVVDRDPGCKFAGQLPNPEFANVPLRLVVDSWDHYVAEWMAAGPEALGRDAMVPSPLMPQLCLDWLMSRASAFWPERKVSVQPLPAAPAMPWQRAAPDGRHYVSFATWICPVNCIEPARCPETRGPRDWSMPPALEEYVTGQGSALDGSLIFHCTHRTYGVGMIDAAAIAAAAGRLEVMVNEFPLRVLVGTVSHCHGALGMLTID